MIAEFQRIWTERCAALDVSWDHLGCCKDLAEDFVLTIRAPGADDIVITGKESNIQMYADMLTCLSNDTYDKMRHEVISEEFTHVSADQISCTMQVHTH